MSKSCNTNTSHRPQTYSCPECGHNGLLSHNLGQVCPVCGIVRETMQFDHKIPFYRDRQNNPHTYHAPNGFPTTIGKKKERTTPKYRNLNHIQYIFRDGLLEEAQNFFTYYLGILDIDMRVEDLVINFGKIYSKLPKFSRKKNVANLCFGILFKTAQPIYRLKLKSTCRKCGRDVKKIMTIFRDLVQYQQLFETDDTAIILHSISALQEKCGIMSRDIPYIRKILKDPTVGGLIPQIKAAKALILYLKAKQLTQFFQILQNEKIFDWITLLRHLSDLNWCLWVEGQIQALNLKYIAQELQVSKTQIYTCYGQDTWIKSRVMETSPESVIKCGKIRIPESCLNAFFTSTIATQNKNQLIGAMTPITPITPIQS
ncbi:MAG: TFIIB-type zinc ribbon-containing protein [Promethearchaeota archaeon]